MKQIFKRLLVFVIGIPFLIVILFYLPWWNHFAFSMVVITVSVIGAVEFADILRLKNLPIHPVHAAILGGLGPLFAILIVNFGLDRGILAASFCLGAVWVLVYRIFSSKKELDSFVNSTAAGLSVMIYPGLFMAWIIPLAAFPRGDILILIYLLITFMNDGAAWLTGMLFGKNNRGIVAASPNKSIAGFIGGISASAFLGFGAAYFFPEAFLSPKIPWFLSGVCLGLTSGAASILGDLTESCLKRSAGIKDSGSIIPGRGGMLDSIDSLALTAPVFYFMFRLLFKTA
jgi:phosphatidate cytidylyltransferase